MTPSDGRTCFSAAISSGSPATKPERYPGIDERLDSEWNARTCVGSSTCRTDGGRLPVEPDLAVGLVGREHDALAAAALGELAVERERGDRAGRVAREVDPDQREAPPDLGAEGVERGQPAGLRVERHLDDAGPGGPRAAAGDGVARAS